MSVSPNELRAAEAGLMSAITAAEKKFQGQLTSLGAAKGVSAEASTLLGLDFQAKQYDARREALVDPAAYATKRATAFDEMKKAVNIKFDNAMKEYVASGLPPETAKKFALQAAANESAIQQQIFEVSFPSGANILELGAQAHRFKGLGDVTAPPRRRAPARSRRR